MDELDAAELKRDGIDLVRSLSEVLNETSKDLAESYYKLFTELQEAGFTEEQAMEIVKNHSTSLSGE